MKSHPPLMGFTVIIILLSVGMSGCDTPTPLSAIPSVIYYYADNETRVFVTGEEYMYEGINITIENESKTGNFTYGLTHNTSVIRFQLEVRVCDNEGNEEDPKYQWYTYSSSVRLEFEDEKTNFIIIDNHHTKEITREAPYKTLMEKEQ